MDARPRRALKAPIGVRMARVGGPAVVAGALITSVAVAAWPTSPVEAMPAIPATVTVTPNVAPAGEMAIGAESVRAAQADRADRGHLPGPAPDGIGVTKGERAVDVLLRETRGAFEVELGELDGADLAGADQRALLEGGQVVEWGHDPTVVRRGFRRTSRLRRPRPRGRTRPTC